MKTMKTKTFFLTLIFISLHWISSASVIHVHLNNINYVAEWHYFCTVDTIIIHKPTTAMSGIYWTTPGGTAIFDEDSVIVTASNTGSWAFYSSEVSKDVHIYILSSGPTEPTCMATDTSFCTATFSLPLDAQNQNPGGQASTYLWSTGQTNRIITVTTPGTYTVTITNACGTGIYSKNVYHANPNAPDLGPDQAFCWGQSSVLDPGSTNVTSYQWSTGATTPTITVDTTGTYWVYVVDNNGCSGRDTVEITTLLPTPEEVCFVEFDTVTWKNNINWTSNLPGNADSVKIYKETSLNVWTLIGTVGTTTTNFLDLASAPQAQSYSYRIAVVDTCGNESNKSGFHTTITLLSTYDAGTSTYGFTWSAYHGLVVNDYYLFGIDASNTVTQIATVPGNVFMYNYVNPNLAYIKYFVGFEAPTCGAKSNVIVKSNWVQSTITSIEDQKTLPFSIYPNPASDQITIEIGSNNFHVEVTTLLGQVVLSEINTNVLNVAQLPQGVYIISVSVDGVWTNQRFIKH